MDYIVRFIFVRRKIFMVVREKPSLFRGYYVVAAGFGIWFIGWGSYSISFGVFLKPIIAEFGWSRADATLAYSSMFMVQATIGILMGWLTDRIGSRSLMLWFGSFIGISYLLLSQVNDLWQFQLSYALAGGIGTSVLNIPVIVAVSRWFRKGQGTMLGIVQAGAGIGGFIFPPLSGWIILSYGWREAYFSLGICTLVIMFICGLYLRSDPVKAEVSGKEDAGAGAPTQKPASQERVQPPVRRPMFQGAFWMLMGIYGSFGFCRATFLAHIAAHTQDLGFTLSDGAFITALISGSSIAGRVGTGRLSDKLGNRAALAVSFGITTMAILLALEADRLWMLYLFGLAFGFAWGAQAVLRFTATSEVFGLSSLGFLLGLLSFIEAIAAMLGSYLGGYVFDLFGNYRPIFWAGVCIAALGGALSFFLKPRPRTS
ncbi:MAG: MFS transporter [Deltaproteobacteria bacterium HGW-Deltaproteobacteria-15]|nr:MAG: MFS transporter [Deltaproteobacteria bacterium HGW-Deltaproteobacteria-15]